MIIGMQNTLAIIYIYITASYPDAIKQVPQAPCAPSATPFIAPGYEAVYITLHRYYVGTTYPKRPLFYSV